MNKILITGCAGFIGFHLANDLKTKGFDVVGFDNYNNYYDVNLKMARAFELAKRGIKIQRADLQDKNKMLDIIGSIKPDIVIHLAAHAGVRHSMDAARDYIENNIIGTQNLIEACELYNVSKIIYASTSCIMAGNQLPWKEDEPTNHQLNPYGYTKKTNECQFKISKIEKVIGLRFFTVYGPWGRPDMALFSFTKDILEDKAIDIFNYGDMKRDFTYIDDIVQGINIAIDRLITFDKSLNEIYNIGYGQQVNLLDFVAEIETNLGKTANKNLLPKHPADTQETWSDITKLQKLGYNPNTPIKQGVANFISWYKNYYKIKGITNE
jgi:UDP-glucuronate 4-epimerase